MDPRAAFVLNLDADLELGSSDYRSTRTTRDAIRLHARTLAETLLRPGDRCVDASDPDGSCAGMIGRAFSPTPSALAELKRVAAIVPDSPSIEVLRRVCRRDFAYLHELDDALCSNDAETVLEHLRSRLAPGISFRLKRVRGMAGRGHRVVRELLTEHDERFVRMSEGLVVEPEVTIEDEFSLHGFLRPDGHFVSGDLVRSTVDGRGVWRETMPIDPRSVDAETRSAISASFEQASELLGTAGYFGPFGIDAFVYRDGARSRLRTRGEVNARYSMGWAIGMRRVNPRPDFM